MSIFYSLEVVSRGSETQLQVVENLKWITSPFSGLPVVEQRYLENS